MNQSNFLKRLKNNDKSNIKQLIVVMVENVWENYKVSVYPLSM